MLDYARGVICDFNAHAEDELQKLRLSHSDHEKKANNVGVLKPSQAAWLIQGIVAGIDAARAIRTWRPDEDLPHEFVRCASDCVEAYAKAWKLDGQPVQASQSSFHGGSSASPAPKIDAALNRLAGLRQSGPHLTTTTWLILRRLLTYLLGGEDTGHHFSTEATVLLYHEYSGDGRAELVHVQSAEEGQFGFYLDPVTMGMTTIELPTENTNEEDISKTMSGSLNLGWKICKSELMPQRDGQRMAPLAIRLSPKFQDPWSHLSGGSAGGLLCCAMYAAATETGLNTDASASIAIVRDQNAGPDTGQLKPHNIRVAPVSDASIPAKLEAAAARRPEPLRRVVLHHEQAKNYLSIGRPEVLGAENLKQVFDYLTGDAQKERVLEAYCRARVEEWKAACRDENDPDRLVHYVPAHYSLLKEGFQPSDASSRFGSGGKPQPGAGEESDQDPYKPVAASGDDEQTELTKLLRTSRLLCISEDAGAGKSIFTRRLLAFLSSPGGQAALFGSKPCLAVRWEEWTDEWPADFCGALAKAVAPVAQDVSPNLAPADIAKWAIRHERVVIILDALDQVSDTSRIKALARFLNEPAGKKCRVVLTARSYAVSEKRNTLFHVAGWHYGRIDGFDRAQQKAYLHGLYEHDLSELFPNYDEVKELLRIPVVLSMIRGLAERHTPLEAFRTRAELYLQASYHMIQLAGTKLRENFEEDVVLDLEEILAAVAFQMMSGQQYDYAVPGPDRVRALRKAAGRRCGREITDDHWKMMRAATGLTRRCILEGSTEQSLSFKHRGMMEFYCGLHLARNRQEGWVAKDVEEESGEDRSLATSATMAVRCGDQAVRRFAADPNWYWAFRFAIEMPSGVWQDEPVTLAASLAELFQSIPRPTELMYRAWPLLDPELVDPARQDLDPKRATLPLGPAILGSFCSDDQALVDSLEFVRCPKDKSQPETTFWMGSDESDKDAFPGERPRHRVRLTAYDMMAKPVTNAQYELFDPSHKDKRNQLSQQDDCPVIYVAWYDAWVFAKWLGGQYRLPTEAEWECACRAGTTTKYHSGDTQADAARVGWYGANSNSGTQPVGGKDPNAWGLYDMHGNVWEWCADWYDSDYYEISEISPPKDPAGAITGSGRVARGGSWGIAAAYGRSAGRFSDSPDDRNGYHGFRVACSPSGR